MVLPASHRISRVPWYSGTLSRKMSNFRLRGYHPLWRAFPGPSTSTAFFDFPTDLQISPTIPHNPALATPASLHKHGLGCSPFARRYSENRCCFLFLRVLRCFSSPRSLPAPIYSARDDRALPRPGSPIQKSPGLSLVSGSPKLIAATHVFRRFLMPRHPPFALSSLAIVLRCLILSYPYSVFKERGSLFQGLLNL